MTEENVEAVRAGFILKHTLKNIRKFGIPAVVAINEFITDTEAESTLKELCAEELPVELAVGEWFGRWVTLLKLYRLRPSKQVQLTTLV